MRETHSPSGSQQTPLKRLLILTSERSLLGVCLTLPQPAPRPAFSTEPLYWEANYFPCAEACFWLFHGAQPPGGDGGNLSPPDCVADGLKILINWSSPSYPGWAPIERQSLPRIRRDYYFPRMASSINSSLPGSELLAGRALCLHDSRAD